MIRGVTYYNSTAHSFNVEGDLLTSYHVGAWLITVEVHYDTEFWPLNEALGV